MDAASLNLPPSGKKRKARPLSLGLAALYLAAASLCCFHHHKDLKDHPDCAICTLAHHCPAEIPVLPVIPAILPKQSFAFLVLVLPALIALASPSPEGRAPPRRFPPSVPIR